LYIEKAAEDYFSAALLLWRGNGSIFRF